LVLCFRSDEKLEYDEVVGFEHVTLPFLFNAGCMSEGYMSERAEESQGAGTRIQVLYGSRF
jgi:hypothetical protein